MGSVGIVWFTTDLRLHDNVVLAKALSRHERLLFVFCLNASNDTSGEDSLKKMGLFRRIFLYQSLLDLDKNLKLRAAGLVIVEDKNLANLAVAIRAECVYASYHVASQEQLRYQKIATQLSRHNIKLDLEENDTLYPTSALPFGIADLPDIFTQFRKKTEYICAIPTPIGSPDFLNNFQISEHLALDCLSFEPQTFGITQQLATESLRFMGGESAGLARLNAYFWQKNLVATYKQTRNGLLGQDYSSKFSPWLALGCVSARQIYHQLKKYENQRTANESTYWLYFELQWREYFRLVARRYGNKIFKQAGLRNTDFDHKNPYEPNKEWIEKWQQGRTGIPFIDANMLELAQTGYMSNRGRQNVASFFVHELGQNWQAGAAYFESQLLDYDVYSNWGNWQYVAGVGNDPRPNRRFNILRQAQMYDLNGQYVLHWLPQLAGLPTYLVHTPWKAGPVLNYFLPVVKMDF